MMGTIQVWELLSYMITVIGLPVAIFFFVYEQRRQRENEEEEIYQILSDGYIDFLKLAIANPDLKLQANSAISNPTAEQKERMLAMFGILVSLFERAYLVVYDEKMSHRRARRWRSWEDFMQEWCRREDFRDNLPFLLVGEDPDFADHIRAIADKEAQRAKGTLRTATVST
jgi:hypothetical protein